MKTYTTDASGRLCLGKEFANKMFSLEVKHGNIELIPVQIVPEKKLGSTRTPKQLRLFSRG